MLKNSYETINLKITGENGYNNEIFNQNNASIRNLMEILILTWYQCVLAALAVGLFYAWMAIFYAYIKLNVI